MVMRTSAGKEKISMVYSGAGIQSASTGAVRSLDRQTVIAFQHIPVAGAIMCCSLCAVTLELLSGALKCNGLNVTYQASMSTYL